ncbi:MAG: ABC transporter ATP-binding protein [Clostridiales bacterium]|nr:ABC transporter ATP-binding protein [Clostridiales bacterium]
MDIVVKNLCKSYGEQKVLKDFSHVFREGKTTCIMGASGCGKTTLFRLFLGLEKPDGGEINGVPYGHLGVVFQEDRLCENLSAVSNLRLISKRKLNDVEIDEALLQVGLAEAKQKPVRKLSGGMRRRVAILRALFAEADCLFMDEPLKGLDEESKKRTVAYIREKAKGKTLLVITHDKEEAKLLGAEEVLDFGI